MSETFVIIGGGLSGGMAAVALAEARRADVVLIEQGPRLGGNHTWSFHETDLDDGERQFVEPFVAWRWDRQLVRFPGRERALAVGYASVTSERFERVVSERMRRGGARVATSAQVVEVGERAVRLADGRVFDADVVLDARGPEAAVDAGGYQKFVGLELELEVDGPWTAPVIMDATVAQREGFAFVYVLPFTPRTVLVEDTLYADDAALDVAATEARVLAYATAHGARVTRVRRREAGVLPLPVRQTPVAVAARGEPLRIGYRGGFFHPVTGYSLPLAVRVARALAEVASAREVRPALAALAHTLAPQRRFGCLLNRLLFGALAPPERWRALERFYRLPDATITRFYASRTTTLDRARLLLGRPPAGISWRRLAGFAEAA